MKRYLALILAIGLLATPTVSLGATIYTQNFNGLTVGALAGQDSWTTSGGNSATVQTSTVQEGANAVQTGSPTAGSSMDRAFSAVSTGTITMELWVYKTNTTQTFDVYYLTSSSSGRMIIRFGANGNMWYLNTGGSFTDLGAGWAYASSTWYNVIVEADVSGNQFRFKVPGLNSSNWTSWFGLYSTGNLGYIRMTSGSTNDSYYDNLSIYTGSYVAPVGGYSRKLRGTGLSR